METGSRKWGRPYLTRKFYSLIGETHGRQGRADDGQARRPLHRRRHQLHRRRHAVRPPLGRDRAPPGTTYDGAMAGTSIGLSTREYQFPVAADWDVHRPCRNRRRHHAAGGYGRAASVLHLGRAAVRDVGRGGR